MGKLNVAIADDNEVMRDLLEEMVTSDDELHLIGMAKDGEEACHLIKEKEPDVVLLDIIMCYFICIVNKISDKMLYYPPGDDT